MAFGLAVVIALLVVLCRECVIYKREQRALDKRTKAIVLRLKKEADK